MTPAEICSPLPPASRDPGQDNAQVRENCKGEIPLDARLEPWMAAMCEGNRLHELVQRYRSPLNILCTSPFRRQIREFRQLAASLDLDFEVYFARKANKCLGLVDAAKEIGCGVDTASEVELEQVLERGVSPSKIVCTAAVKSERLIDMCVQAGVVIVIDNRDELQRARSIACSRNRTARVALRVSGFEHQGQKLDSRFGVDVDEVGSLVESVWPQSSSPDELSIVGVHFHLDGYCPLQRVSAIQQSLALIDEMRRLGHRPTFLDMGGGIPISYLTSARQWEIFWSEHRKALLNERSAITYGNHGLGLLAVGGNLHGRRNTYPYFQTPVQTEWLLNVLTADIFQGTIAAAIRSRNLQLRCEPGRSALDGCGLTVARVEFRKQHRDGDWLIGLSMNGTQCRTSSDDFLVDPLLIRRSAGPATPPVAGYLVGAYCTETELLTLRRLRFPQGVSVGDLIIFPNTAGYLMHFRESRSHQFPLAKNIFVDPDLCDEPMLDDIDREGSRDAATHA